MIDNRAARQARIPALLAIILCIGVSGQASEPKQIEQWGVFELSQTETAAGSPYQDLELRAEFTHGSHTLTVPGFYDGKGVYKVRFSPDRPPTMIGNDKVTGVRIYNQLTGEESDLSARTVVLTTPLAADACSSDLAQMLKVPIDREGFFLEAHLKLRPVEFATDGVFIAGAARFPADIGEAVAQGIAAAAKAAAPMFAGEVSVEATTAVTASRLCSGCGTCEAVCPFGAIEITQDRHGRPVSDVNAVMCKGCGACAASCPCGAIQQLGFTDSQIFEMVRSLARDGDPSGPEA